MHASKRKLPPMLVAARMARSSKTLQGVVSATPLCVYCSQVVQQQQQPRLSLVRKHGCWFSSSASSTTKNDTAATTSNNVASLKDMVKPFFLKCHPDVQTSAVAKKVNLEALKTINAFLDAMEATCNSSSNGLAVQWPSSPLQIEFLMTIEPTTTRKNKKKKKEAKTSRRRVELVVPSSSLRDSVTQSFGEQKRRAMQRLRDTMQHELAKVLKVAGLPVPRLRPLIETTDYDHDDDQDGLRIMWEEELGFVKRGAAETDMGGRRFFDRKTTTRPKTRYERSRDEFVRTFNWKRYREVYDRAVRDMYADIATEGHVAENAARRQQVIHEVISRVRIAKDADIGLVDQIVTLRRLTLLLEDHFDDLHIEDMGRMWETLVIVLTSERDFNISGSAMRKRRLRSQESGFGFTYGADDIVTIHIPIDFGDEELIGELDQNLWDFYILVDDEAAEFYPRSWMEQHT